MSYTSGMALGLAIGQQLFTTFAQPKDKKTDGGNGLQAPFDGVNFKSFNPQYVTEQVEIQTVKLISAIKGRRRYYVEMIKNNPRFAKLIAVKLQQLPYISSIQTNIHTGSLLVTYTAAEEMMDKLFEKLKDTTFKATRKVKRIANEGLTTIESALIGFVHDLNEWIRKQTGNLLDLNNTLAIFFIIRGIRKVLNQGERPTGPMMLWWAYSLLQGFLNRA